MARAGKRKRVANPETADGADTSASMTPSPVKRARSNMSPEEKDADWVQEHEFGEMTDEQILGMF